MRRLPSPHLLLIVLVGQLPLLVLQPCPPDLCRAQLMWVTTDVAAFYFKNKPWPDAAFASAAVGCCCPSPHMIGRNWTPLASFILVPSETCLQDHMNC